MNVLSLFDGISCGQIAFEKLGVTFGNTAERERESNQYFASEIKKEAIDCSRTNFPDIIQIGDVKKIHYKDNILYTENGNFEIKFDIVMFGSPCQSFSRAMKTKGRIGLEDDMRSGIFLECKRILDEVKPKYFLMENVIMKQEDKDVITEMLGVEPIRINSSLVSAQLRDRLYWTNIPNVTIPKDKHIVLQDILTEGYTEKRKSRCLMCCDSHGYYNGCNWNAPARFHREHNKAFSTMIYPNKESYEKCIEKSNEILQGRKSRAEYFNSYQGHEFDCMRYLNKIERARLQTIPEKYVECLNEKDAANLLGDGWTVDVISHILSFIPEIKN